MKSLLFLLASMAPLALAWDNEYDQPLNFTCPPGEYINHILSVHDNKHEDRLWDFSCRPDPKVTTLCLWTGYVNTMDAPMSFECPRQDTTEFVIAGAHSIHDNQYEDRIWSYLCCQMTTCASSPECTLSGFVNEYDGDMDFTVPSGYFLNHVNSQHDNDREDRIWEYGYCTCP